MKRNKNRGGEQQPARRGHHENPLPGEINKRDKQIAERAHDEALNDIKKDVDLSAPSPIDDLDEGEAALYGSDKTDLV